MQLAQAFFTGSYELVDHDNHRSSRLRPPIRLFVMIALPAAILVLWGLIVASVRGTKLRLLLVLVPIAAICAPISSCIVKTILFPVEIAEVAVPDSAATVRLEFYGVLDWNQDNDSGRYLILKSAAGEVRHNMLAKDWVHWPRTSIYLMGDGRLAVLGPTYDDYVLDPKGPSIEELRAGTASGTWTYLGAFDFKQNKLDFIPASEQRECTDTRGMDYAWQTRPQGRSARCRQDELKS
jgi:hypothetical protein